MLLLIPLLPFLGFLVNAGFGRRLTKAQSGADPLTGAPAPATPNQLRELGLRVIEQPAKPADPVGG